MWVNGATVCGARGAIVYSGGDETERDRQT